MQRIDFQSLLSLLYDSMIDSSAMDCFLEKLTHATGGGGAVWLRPDQPSIGVVSVYNKDPEFFRIYPEYGHLDYTAQWCQQNPWQFGYSEELWAREPDKYSSDVEREARRWEATYRIGASFVSPSGRMGIVAVHRGYGAGAFQQTDEAKLIIDSLLPHMAQALHVASLISTAQASNRILVDALYNAGQIVVAFDTAGRVIANSSGITQTILGQGAIRINEHGISFASPRWTTLYKRLLNGSLAAGRFEQLSAGGCFKVPTAGNQTRFIKVCVVPFCGNAGQIPRPCAVALISLDNASGPDWKTIGALYGLSRAEARVLSLLTDGCSTAEIAEKLGTNSNTVRAHIKQCLSKCNVRRQSELVRLVLTGPAPFVGGLTGR